MEPILSKQEIADLLVAIKAGRVSTDLGDEGAAATRQIVYTEVDLLHMSGKRDDNIRIPNFDIILDAFLKTTPFPCQINFKEISALPGQTLSQCPSRNICFQRKNRGDRCSQSFTPQTRRPDNLRPASILLPNRGDAGCHCRP